MRFEMNLMRTESRDKDRRVADVLEELDDVLEELQETY